MHFQSFEEIMSHRESFETRQRINEVPLVVQGIERLQQFELWKHQEHAKRRANEEKRQERLQSEALQRQEEAAKRSLQAHWDELSKCKL